MVVARLANNACQTCEYGAINICCRKNRKLKKNWREKAKLQMMILEIILVGEMDLLKIESR